jgi:hypothetical protein
MAGRAGGNEIPRVAGPFRCGAEGGAARWRKIVKLGGEFFAEAAHLGDQGLAARGSEALVEGGLSVIAVFRRDWRGGIFA